MSIIRSVLSHPLTRGLDRDDPATTSLRREILRSNRFLSSIYHDWYTQIEAALPPVRGPVIEVGSGAGFLSDYIPGLICSEIFLCPRIAVVMDSLRMPFPDNSLRAVVMTDVLHHLPRVRDFFAEATRCLVPGGRVIMIEPWVTAWSRIVYRHLHHEPFEPNATRWEFDGTGPLSGANGALPWVVFQRDRGDFEQNFPQLKVVSITPHTPFRYLVSGGVSMRPLMPGFTTSAWKWIEKVNQPWINHLAMFATIVLERSPAASPG